MTPVFGLRAPTAVTLNRFVQFVIRTRDAALAIVGAQTGHSGEH